MSLFMEYEINSITGTERSEDIQVATLHTAVCRLRVSETCSVPAPTLVQGRAPRRHALPFSPWSLASQRTFSERMYQGASTALHFSAQRVSGAQETLLDSELPPSRSDETGEPGCESRLPGAESRDHRSAARSGGCAQWCSQSRRELEIL